MIWNDNFHSSNYIHQTAIVDSSVVMGKNNFIGPFTTIGPDVEIGDGNRFESYCSIGSPPEHKQFFKSSDNKGVKIGSNNTFREFVTVNAGAFRRTEIGDGCIMLRGSHHSHDSIMENLVTLSCNVLIGGHGHVMEGANVGLGAITHQYQVIGAYCILGMGTIVPKGIDLLPGYKFVGNPARMLSRNEVGLERAGVTEEKLMEHQMRFWVLRGKT
jgi:UDP-N-acetylglucosamine acyltransferase